jgi:hypothetical protein
VGVGDFICLNQDVQDLRIFRILVCVEDFIRGEDFLDINFIISEGTGNGQLSNRKNSCLKT